MNPEAHITIKIDPKLDRDSGELFLEFQGIAEALSREVIQLRNDEVRRALIDLGWIPPEDNRMADLLGLLRDIHRNLPRDLRDVGLLSEVEDALEEGSEP